MKQRRRQHGRRLQERSLGFRKPRRGAPLQRPSGQGRSRLRHDGSRRGTLSAAGGRCGSGSGKSPGSAGGYVSEQLKDKAKQHPNEIVSVIIQSDSGLDAASKAAKELGGSIAHSS